MNNTQLKKFCDLYNDSDYEAFVFLQKNDLCTSEEQKTELEIVLLENQLIYDYNSEDINEDYYHNRKYNLLKSLGVTFNDMGEAICKEDN